MKIDVIKREMTNNGQDPNDYIIVINGDVVTVWEKDFAPKPLLNARHLAKQEDKPIIEDVNATAELTAITAMDKDELAEMLVFALTRIDELEARLNG